MVRYYIVRHEGSWAYKMGDSYSETFPNRDHAIVAALTAVDEASDQGTDGRVLVQDETGRWVEVPPEVLTAVRHGKGLDEIRAQIATAEPVGDAEGGSGAQQQS